MSLVSVIIPSFNHAHFVSSAIESVLSQTHKEVEAIVVDDGSTDNTSEVVAPFGKDPRVRYLRQDNKGLPAARNLGIRHAKGIYIAFLDADDSFLPDKLAKDTSILDLDAAIGMVICDVQHVDGQMNPIDDGYSVGKARSVVSGDIFDSLLQGGYFPPVCVTVRKTVLETHGLFVEDLGGNADYELWLRLAGSGVRSHYVDKKLACYRIHESNMSKNVEHMKTTLERALHLTTERFSGRLAHGLLKVQQTSEDMARAHGWLINRWDDMTRAIATIEPGDDVRLNASAFVFADHLDEAVMVEGTKTSLDKWVVEIGPDTSTCLLVHPVSSVQFRVASSAPGKFVSAVSLHPDVWENKCRTRGIAFTIIADGTAMAQVILNPVHAPVERRWHHFVLPIPSGGPEGHSIILRTHIPDGLLDYCWAMWRNPMFIAQDSSAGQDS